jgi:hypothetical protein
MAGAASIEMVTVALADPLVDPVAVTVYAADPLVAVGVPEITPVEESSTSPAGSVGDAVYDTVPLKSDAVKAVVAVTAVPTIPAMVCVAGVIEACA